jgi:hypothetical protein
MAADFSKQSEEPAPVDPGAGAAARSSGFLERRRRQARLRERLAVREEMLLELGAIVFELHRQGQRAPELLQARAAELDEVDAEVRAMQRSLAADDPAAWPDDPGTAPDWSEQTGEWDAAGTGEWEAGTGEWDTPADADWGETGEWEATGQTGDFGEQGELQETGDWASPPDVDPDATQEWSAPDAFDATDVSADPHDAAAEDAATSGDDRPREERR